MPMTLVEALAAILFGILVPGYILYNGYSQKKSMNISKQMKMGMLEQMLLMLEDKNEQDIERIIQNKSKEQESMRRRFQIVHIIISVCYSLSLIAIFISVSYSPNIHINMLPNVASFPWHFIGLVILFWNIFCMLFNFWFIFEGLRISRELKNFQDNENK